MAPRAAVTSSQAGRLGVGEGKDASTSRPASGPVGILPQAVLAVIVSWGWVRCPPPLLVRPTDQRDVEAHLAERTVLEAEWTTGYAHGMANPKVVRPCSSCGISREHYTRRNGRVISPCAECQIAKDKARKSAIRDDPDALEHQRAEWTRIKKRQRMIERGEIGTHTAEPAIQPGQIPMVERVQRRRRRTAEGVQLPERLPVSPEAPSPSRRRRRRRSAQTSMEAGLD